MSDERPLREADPLAADRIVDTPAQIASARPAVPAGWDEAADLSADPATVPELADTDVPDALRAEVEAAMANYPDRHSAALPALHAAQRVHGWCSPDAVQQVAAVMRVTPAYLTSITTFYDMFDTEPRGRHHVYVCTSVACNLVGAQPVFEALHEAGGGLDDFYVREFECLGACDMAPMASVDGRFVGPLDVSDADEVIGAVREGRVPLPGRGLEAVDEQGPEVGSRQEAGGSAEGADQGEGREGGGSGDG